MRIRVQIRWEEAPWPWDIVSLCSTQLKVSVTTRLLGQLSQLLQIWFGSLLMLIELEWADSLWNKCRHGRSIQTLLDPSECKMEGALKGREGEQVHV